MRRWLAPLLIAFTLTVLAVELFPMVASRHTLAGRPPSWTNRQDPDTPLLHQGLQDAPRFADTLRWWTGRWVGKLPYYRPLTSYGFWFEWKAFGDQEWLYGYPTAVAHGAATLLFALFAFRLARWRRVPWPWLAAAVAVTGFVFGIPGFFFHSRFRVNNEIIWHWKKHPDSWTACCCFAALLCYLRAQRGSRRGLAAAAGWFAVGCGFKELTLPLLAVFAALELEVLLGPGRAAAFRRLGAVTGVAACFVLLRVLFVRQGWFSYASNGSWAERTLSELLGAFSAGPIAGEWAGNAIGVWFVLILGTSGRWRRRFGQRLTPEARGLAAGLVALLGVLVIGSVSLAALGTFFFLGALCILWRHDRWSLVFAVAWTAAFLALYTFSPGNIYRYYLPQCGYFLALGLAAGFAAPAWYGDLAGRLPSRRAALAAAAAPWRSQRAPEFS